MSQELVGLFVGVTGFVWLGLESSWAIAWAVFLLLFGNNLSTVHGMIRRTTDRETDDG